jgi:hypothetical protein
MATFQTQVISLVCNVNSKDNVLDLSTSAEPEAWWARDLQIRASTFSDSGQTILDVSDIQSATLSLKDPGNIDGTPLFSQTLNTFDNTTTATTWTSGAQQHMLFTLPADGLSFSLSGGSPPQRLLHLSITAITTAGKTGTLCVGTLNLIDDGGSNPGGNPANAITVAQADAMLANLGFSGTVDNLNAAGNTAISNNQTWLIGRQPISLAAGTGVYIQNLTLSDANALAGAVLRVIVDFPASANPTINIYDGSTAGALLQGPLTNPTPALAQSFYFQAGFDGTNWHKEDGRWV